MKATRLYAQVLIDAIQAPNSGFALDKITSELNEFSKVVSASPLFLQVFDNPAMSDSEKQKALKEFTSRSSLSPLSARFLSMLTKRRRMSGLADILKEIEVIQIEKQGGIIGELTSAVPLDPAVTSGVAEALSKKLNKKVQLHSKVDPGIIAGMRVTIGGVTYDGSVKGKLDKLSQQF
jgi:F-type H+-transporting ATPase subunit delta